MYRKTFFQSPSQFQLASTHQIFFYWIKRLVIFSPIALTLFVFSNCQKEPAFKDPALQPYIDAFVEEAVKRGQDISVDQLEAVILPIVEDNGVRICGLGYAPAFGNNFRKIEIDELCWKFASEAEREILVFHELGHAILDRTHNDWKLGNGRVRSIMFSGDNCDIYASYETCQLDIREYYVDELFKEAVTVPLWTRKQHIDRIYFTDDFDRVKLGWTTEEATPNTALLQDSTIYNSAPYALRINSLDSGEEHFWQREVPLFPIKTCSNITVSLFVKTENLNNGRLQLAISYPNFDTNDQSISQCTHAFFIGETTNNKEQFQKHEFNLRCVSGGKKDMDIQLRLEATNSSAAVLVDDLSMRLWD